MNTVDVFKEAQLNGYVFATITITIISRYIAQKWLDLN